VLLRGPICNLSKDVWSVDWFTRYDLVIASQAS
jgi:hypothetical protein